MHVTLRLANHKRIARMPPSKTTSKPQPGLYPNNSSDCHLPIHPTLCSGPPPSLYPIPEGGSFPGGPAASQAFSGKLGTRRTRAGLQGRTPSAEPETQGHPGPWPQLAHRLKEHLKRAELGKKKEARYQGSFILSCPLSISVTVSLSFCFTVSSPKDYVKWCAPFSEILWETNRSD